MTQDIAGLIGIFILGMICGIAIIIHIILNSIHWHRFDKFMRYSADEKLKEFLHETH